MIVYFSTLREMKVFEFLGHMVAKLTFKDLKGALLRVKAAFFSDSLGVTLLQNDFRTDIFGMTLSQGHYWGDTLAAVMPGTRRRRNEALAKTPLDRHDWSDTLVKDYACTISTVKL